MVEGAFVVHSDRGPRIGFHTTFYLSAFNAISGSKALGELLSARMASHNVHAQNNGILRSFFVVSDAWEVTEKLFLEKNGIDSGFTFFRIGVLESVQLIIDRHRLASSPKVISLPTSG